MEDGDRLFQFQTKRPEITCQNTARPTTLEKFCTELIVKAKQLRLFRALRSYISSPVAAASGDRRRPFFHHSEPLILQGS
jgi:hypothetical protein